jgi:uncharacterized metal-binding protein YceD (DUF177 family)
MKIPFNKINSYGKEFKYKSDVESVLLNGKLKKSSYHTVLIEGNLKGIIEVSCDRCGTKINRKIDENIEFILSDQYIETKDNLDIIEFLDGIIDIDYIVNSEINSSKFLYNYCSTCQNLDNDFEIEF